MEAVEDAVDQAVGADVPPDPRGVAPKVVAGHRVAVVEEDRSEGLKAAIAVK